MFSILFLKLAKISPNLNKNLNFSCSSSWAPFISISVLAENTNLAYGECSMCVSKRHHLDPFSYFTLSLCAPDSSKPPKNNEPLLILSLSRNTKC